MIIKQDPISKLRCRSDGAVLMPPSRRFKLFRWTLGSKHPTGYLQIKCQGISYYVHQIVCRAFNGLPPADKPEVDHINRIKDDNRPENLRWVDHKENQDNKDYVDQSIEKYKVRCCDDRRAYNRAYHTVHREEHKVRSKSYYEAHHEEAKAYAKSYYEAHREELKDYRERRKASTES